MEPALAKSNEVVDTSLFSEIKTVADLLDSTPLESLPSSEAVCVIKPN